MEKIPAVRGTVDILPGEVEIWQTVESVVRKWTAMFGFEEIRTPIFEETRLFVRSIGEDSDIVGKEMYTFNDLGKRSLTLRPEGTASVVRSFIEHSLDQRGLPQALWYMGPMFRQERPQKGRQRQFHQFGLELIGSPHEMADVNVIWLFDLIANDLGLENRMLTVNFIGGKESRDQYRIRLVEFLEIVENDLCPDCRRRKTSNPLRVLDCKVPECREIIHERNDFPKIGDSLVIKDKMSYDSIKSQLAVYGVQVREDPFLVRGLDYYTGIVFEMVRPGLGAQSAIMGGGRYDGLVSELGGPDLPAVGWACGMERLILAMQGKEKPFSSTAPVKTFVVIPSGSEGHMQLLTYANELRKHEQTVLVDYMRRSVKAQLRAASKWGAKYVLFESSTPGSVEVKDMGKSTQTRMTFESFLELLTTAAP